MTADCPLPIGRLQRPGGSSKESPKEYVKVTPLFGSQLVASVDINEETYNSIQPYANIYLKLSTNISSLYKRMVAVS